MQLKIAVYHNLPSGGALRSTRSIMERLNRTHVVDCFALSSSADGGRSFEDACRTLKVYDYGLRADRWPKHLRPLGWMSDLKRISRVQEQIAAEINAAGYDVCFTSTCPFFELPAIHRYLTVPVAYYSRSTTYPEILRGAKKRTRPSVLRNPLGPWFDRRVRAEKQELVGLADIVLTNSCFSREELFRLFGVNAVVNYPGVDTDRFFRVADMPAERAVLGVGSIANFKAHDFSVQALATIPEASRPELWIAHHFEEPGEKDYLLALAESSGVRLKLFEKVSTEGLRRLYSAAVATVFPSIFEPLGLVPLESMACGTPVVGVREGGTRETVVDGITGFLTQRDPEEFGAAVLRLVDDPTLAAQMGKAGREHVLANWNWDKAAGQLQTILERTAVQRDGS